MKRLVLVLLAATSWSCASKPPVPAPASAVPAPVSHVAGHGGEIVSVGSDLRFELVPKDGQLALWVLDPHLAPLLHPGTTASLTIQAPGQPVQTVEMTPSTDHFASTASLPPGPATILASVQIDGATRVGRFLLTGRR